MAKKGQIIGDPHTGGLSLVSELILPGKIGIGCGLKTICRY
jgi:hypothetical protein